MYPMKKATLKDIALEAGVSSCLASKILNGKSEGVWASEETKAKIIKAAKVLDYKPNISARRLAGGRKDSIGVFLDNRSDFTSQFISIGLEGVVIRAEELGYSLNLGMAGTGDKLKLLEKGVVDSVILIPSDAFCCHELAERLKKEGVPTVLLNPGGKEQFNAVTCDDKSGVAQAVEHLKSLGHSKIAFMGCPSNHASYKDRLDSFLESSGGGPNFAFNAISAELIRDAIAKSDFTACVLYVDEMLIPFYEACHSLGLEIPNDMSVIGINNCIDPKRFLQKPTNVQVPIHEMARRSVEMLDEIIRKGEAIESVDFGETLVLRDSCAAPKTHSKGE